MAINESRIRQIIKEEARRVLREAYDPRLESEDVDHPAHRIISGLGMPEVEEVYGRAEAMELRKELMRLERDKAFDEGMAVVRPSKGGGPDEFDIFLDYTSPRPINSAPIPRRAFGIMGLSLDTRGGLSSAAARRRGISGY